MAQERLPALPVLAVPAATDLVYVVDVSDTTDHATGTSKKVTVGSLLGGGRIKNTSRYTTTQTISVNDHVVFCNTDSAAWTATLPAGVEGQTFKIINTGTSGNTLTIDGDSSENVMGAATQDVADGEVIDLTYNATDGWW
ncbi:MAG: hypothetical protein GY942_03180 [Aestuariibacter sp.]|nr:hypothetical protein [Aestuariibacter sp.]